MLLRLINGSAQRKVDSGLKMFIEPIQNWLVASQYFKKFCFCARLSCLPIQPKFLGLLRPPNEVAQPQRHQSRNMELSVNNNSNNSKDGIGYYAKGDVERYTGLFFCSVVAGLTLGGNLLVIVAFVTRPALRKVRSNIFILSLGEISVCLFLKSAISGHSSPLRQLSLKIHFIEFNITVPPCKLSVKNLMSKITTRHYNSVQMSIQHWVSMCCSPKIT